jgi:2-polyprenyl-3-methyl-5-hydroxy-6-metoxy-1,4-benzoquinol methylase
MRSTHRAFINQANTGYKPAQDKLVLLGNYYKWIVSLLGDFIGGDVLELGAGAGKAIDWYHRRTERIVAVDHDPQLVEVLAAKKRRIPVLEPVLCDLRRPWADIPDAAFDVVIALDVLEHFEDEARFLDRCRRKLRPRGRLLLKVPAGSRLFGPADEASGHYRRYDGLDLDRKLKAHRFEKIMRRPMNVAGAIAYRFKRRNQTNFSANFSAPALRIINRAIPLLALCDLLPGGKGLSIVAAYRKAQVA